MGRIKQADCNSGKSNTLCKINRNVRVDCWIYFVAEKRQKYALTSLQMDAGPVIYQQLQNSPKMETMLLK